MTVPTTRPTERSARTAARAIAYGGVALAILIAWMIARGPRNVPWEVGKDADVEITLVANDVNELGCAAGGDVAGAHCAFVREGVPTDFSPDTAVLRPYTTTGGRRLLGSGLWSQLNAPLPPGRFSVRCRFAVRGKVPAPGIRWHGADPFVHDTKDWFAGPLLQCQLVR